MIEVLLSIRPEWCRLILKKQKLLELRKSAPRADPPCPFRVYLYETREGRGAVVGECICWMVEKDQRPFDYRFADLSCLDPDQISGYSKGKPIYGWYLGKVVEYQNPRPLEDFGMNRAPQSWCYIKRDGNTE